VSKGTCGHAVPKERLEAALLANDGPPSRSWQVATRGGGTPAASGCEEPVHDDKMNIDPSNTDDGQKTHCIYISMYPSTA